MRPGGSAAYTVALAEAFTIPMRGNESVTIGAADAQVARPEVYDPHEG